MKGEGLSFVYQNFLLTKEFRKTRGPMIPLYNQNIAFGKPVEKDLEGAKEIVNGWKIHAPSKVSPARRNFRSVNKRSVRREMPTSQEARSYSKLETEDNQPPRKQGNKSCLTIHLDDNFTYGQPNKPSTPLNDLLANVYGIQSGIATREIYKTRLAEIQNKTCYLPKATKSSMLNHEQTAKKLQELGDGGKVKAFKLKMFQNVRNKVDTVNREYMSSLRSFTQENHNRSVSHDAFRKKGNL